MTGVLEAAGELQQFCQQQHWRFCFIGGLAVQRWGEPRFTKDADLTLLTGIGEEEKFIDALVARFQSRGLFDREKAILRRVLFLQSAKGIPLDLALGALPFEARAIGRATPWDSGHSGGLITCSADDLVVHKAFAARKQDWLDLESVVIRQGPKLNVAQIWEELRPLVELKEEPEILEKLQRIFDQHLG